jgi:hypothetical protein
VLEKRVLTAAQRRRYTVEFSLDAILRGSLKDRLEIGAQAVQNGLMTRNEWRQLENLPPIKGADILTAQVNLAPIATLGQSTQNIQTIEKMAQTQQMLAQRLADLSSKSDNLSVSVTPNIQFEMPELKLNMDVTKDQSKSTKNIKLIRDDNGNLIGAESNEA